MSGNPNNLESYEEEPAPNRPAPSPPTVPVWKLVSLGVFFMLMLSAWAIYWVNPGWFAGAMTILLSLLLAAIIYKWWPKLYWHGTSSVHTIHMELVLLVVCTTNAWLVHYTHPTFVLFLLAGILTVAIPLRILRIIRGSEETASQRVRDLMTQSVEPSSRTRRTITAGEQLWQEKPRHPVVLTPLVLVVIVALYVSDRITTGVGLLVMNAIVLVWGATVLFLWHRDLYCFSDWRVFRSYGLIGRGVQQMAYAKMTDESSVIPWHSVILAKLRLIYAPYGTFVLESAGQDQALTKVRWVQNAEALKVKIAERSRASNE